MTAPTLTDADRLEIERISKGFVYDDNDVTKRMWSKVEIGYFAGMAAGYARGVGDAAEVCDNTKAWLDLLPAIPVPHSEVVAKCAAAIRKLVD